jgi:hypothetical protein
MKNMVFSRYLARRTACGLLGPWASADDDRMASCGGEQQVRGRGPGAGAQRGARRMILGLAAARAAGYKLHNPRLPSQPHRPLLHPTPHPLNPSPLPPPPRV